MANTQRTFDRLVQFDEQSRNYPIMAVVSTTVLTSKTWECNTWNDQGQEGACVGFGFSHELSAEPQPVPTNYSLALALYNRAKLLDNFAGEDYSGTSVLAGAKAVSELKNNIGEPFIKSYRWAFGLRDVALAVAHVAPVVIGINWYEGMYEPDSAGFLHKSGEQVGGHCTLILGVVIVPLTGVTQPTTLAQVDMKKSYAIIHNSWGKSWGQNGRAKISFADLDALLKENGDACIPLQMTVDQILPPSPSPAPAPAVVPSPSPTSTGTVFSVRGKTTYHDYHPGLRKYKTYASSAEARRAGLRPCNVCKPA